jgi:hypothetical protein
MFKFSNQEVTTMSDQNQFHMNAEEGSRAVIEAKIIARAWKDPEFKSHLLSNPREVLGSYIGRDIPDIVDVKVVEEDKRTLYIVLPPEPTDEAELSEEQLEAIAGGWGFKLLWTAVCVWS